MKTLFSKISKRERFLFIFAASFIFLFAFYVFVIEPLHKKWIGLDTARESASARLFKNLKLLASKEVLQKEHERYKEYIKKAPSQEEETAAVLKEIESFALSAGVKLTAIKPKETKQLKAYKKLNIELTAEATINQMLKFIYDMEGSKNLLKVERLVLSLKGGQPDILKATLIIRRISF